MSLDDEALHLRWKAFSETTLHLANFVADARRVLHEGPFRATQLLAARRGSASRYERQ